jgi:integrase
MRASPPLAELLAVAYLTGFRQTDLLAMQKTAVTAKGLRLRQSKDGKLVTREWTPLLRGIVQNAIGRSETGFVFVGTRGHPWTVSGLQSALRRLNPGFRFRDLRPKAATDAPHNILAHSAQMLPTYLREWSSKALG